MPRDLQQDLQVVKGCIERQMSYAAIEAETGISRRRLYYLRFFYLRDVPMKTPDSGVRKLTPEQEAEAKRLYESGTWSTRRLARRYGVSQATVADVLRRLRYTLIPQ